MPRLPKPNALLMMPLLLVGFACMVGAAAWGVHVQQTRASSSMTAASQTLTLPTATTPAKPTLTAERAWAMVSPQVESSPWLSRADETAAWIDKTGNDAQQLATTVSAKLRELSELINEHWAGKMTVEVLQSIANGSAAFSPSPSMKAAAVGLSYAIEHIDEWSLMLANQTDKLSAWIESFTEPYERYALAYQAMQDDPTAERMHEWLDASQALLPHLEQAERLSRELETRLATVEKTLNSLHTALEGADHWSVEWAAANLDEQVIVPSLSKVEQLTAMTKAIKGRASYDHALIASLPGKFERYELVD